MCPASCPVTAQEYGWLIKHGAEASLCLCRGDGTEGDRYYFLKGYGGAYVVMSSKHIRGDVNYAWPSAEIAVMGSKGAVEILYRSELGDKEKIAARIKEYQGRVPRIRSSRRSAAVSTRSSCRGTRATALLARSTCCVTSSWRCPGRSTTTSRLAGAADGGDAEDTEARCLPCNGNA